MIIPNWRIPQTSNPHKLTKESPVNTFSNLIFLRLLKKYCRNCLLKSRNLTEEKTTRGIKIPSLSVESQINKVRGGFRGGGGWGVGGVRFLHPSGIRPPAFWYFFKIHFWPGAKKTIHKYTTNFEGERAPKKTRFLSKFSKKCPKTAFLPVFSKICLLRRKFGQNNVFSVL